MRLSQLFTAIKAARQLGLTQVSLNTLYKVGLASGHYRRSILAPQVISDLRLKALMPVPTAAELRAVLGEAGKARLLMEADEIVGGKYRQFGGEAVSIALSPLVPLPHWTVCEGGHVAPNQQDDYAHSTGTQPDWRRDDIKFTWEPARFGWAITLGRAYLLSQNEGYAQAFWRFVDEFVSANPPYQGPNWTSGQEVGLRLMAMIWCAQIFAGSTDEFGTAAMQELANQVLTHATRIPATLVYARSQNNNHILTEAAALYSAALALPHLPQAEVWLKTGREWLGWCFNQQIDARGEYVQHSLNYQRLMLQTALWVNCLHSRHESELEFPGGSPARENLAQAARWLLAQLDPLSGRVPNLGANDGALIFPFASADFADFRPVAQAAARAFLSAELPSGDWDEMPLWFGLPRCGRDIPAAQASAGYLYSELSWASLRAVQYSSRPSHADQLHLELWWRGENIARDAGTYLYNAAPPWDNHLTSTLVHNTVSVDAHEQMTRISRFLYLDWAAAHSCDASPRQERETAACKQKISAETLAYARLGVQHIRTAALFDNERWLVLDDLERTGKAASPHTYRLHWLLPDWCWQLRHEEKDALLRIQSPCGRVLQLSIRTTQPIKRAGLVRAGELIEGQALLSPVFGWYSPTYNLKVPALSLAVEVESAQQVCFTTEFIFPADDSGSPS